MLCVNVELKERRYPIYIGEGCLKMKAAIR